MQGDILCIKLTVAVEIRRIEKVDLAGRAPRRPVIGRLALSYPRQLQEDHRRERGPCPPLYDDDGHLNLMSGLTCFPLNRASLEK